ncbi:MAG: bifunctional diguanylate cyclase/phosphodiesterase, partial [Pseudomonadota bacterium]
MPNAKRLFEHLTKAVGSLQFKPWMLSFAPLAALVGIWFGLSGLLWFTACVIPFLAVVSRFVEAGNRDVGDYITGLLNRKGLLSSLDKGLAAAPEETARFVLFVIEIDFFGELAGKLDNAESLEEVQRQFGDRLRRAVRGRDMVARLSPRRFAVAVKAVSEADVDLALQIAERLQRELGIRFDIDASTLFLSSSIGFCMARRLQTVTAQAMLEGATVALEEAQRQGEGMIRSFSVELGYKVAQRNDLREEISSAFDNDEIGPWFQPQISTDTGEVVGFEALARWHHPKRGMIPPGDFLAAVEMAGLMPHLASTMLRKSLAALCEWDRAGFGIMTVGVNFSREELRDPKLPEKVKWELDRFELGPERLAVEVLETVVASTGTDSVTRNIAALSQMGCHIDLDDFGTGSASIANIRRFSVNRLKIDRSFVTNVDTDLNQQKMVSAILLMAD